MTGASAAKQPIKYLVDVAMHRKGDASTAWVPVGVSQGSPWRYSTRDAFMQALPNVVAALRSGWLGSALDREGTAVYTVEADSELILRYFPDLRLPERVTALSDAQPVDAVRLRVLCCPPATAGQPVRARAARG